MNGNKNQYFDIFLQEFHRLRSKSSLVGVVITISPSCIYDNGYFSPVLADSSLSADIDEVMFSFFCLFEYSLAQDYFLETLNEEDYFCLLYTSPSPRDGLLSRMPSSA